MRNIARRSKSSATSNDENINYLDVSHVRDSVHVFVTQHLADVEPMPEWTMVDIGKLSAALASPRQAAYGSDLYPAFPNKVAILSYSMVKAHAWANGNKRMALISTMLFAALNEQWWDVQPEEARAHLTWIAASDSQCFREVMAYLTKYFARKLVPFDQAAVAQIDQSSSS